MKIPVDLESLNLLLSICMKNIPAPVIYTALLAKVILYILLSSISLCSGIKFG